MEVITASSSSSSSAPLERSISQQSATSIRSHRSTARTRKKPSSAASSIAPSDKSLTSFPSFSPESPRQDRSFAYVFRARDDSATTVNSSRKTSGQSFAISEQAQEQTQGQEPEQHTRLQASALVDNLTTTTPLSATRGALFEDAPLASRTIPGALHHADDSHIERLLARHGPVTLVRQIAEDLAQRDAQIASLRRRADERERALRKIILECGLSSLDLETRLRTVEQEARANGASKRTSGDGLSDLMTDAMTDDFRHPYMSSSIFDDATIRVSSVPLPAASEADAAKGSTRGWKDYLWGGGTVKKASRTNTAAWDANKQPPAVVKATATERRPALQDDLFNPPEEDSARSSSRASSVGSAHAPRKPSLASMALRLVAGGATVGRDGDIRGRASSAQGGGSLRAPSSSSITTSGSARAVSSQGGPKALMAMRRPTAPVRPLDIPTRSQAPDRWDTMVATPGGDPLTRHQSYGPVEMDTILPAEAQPPTLTHIYNNHLGADYLTDRFGFIYDQRRKKRQREAAQMARDAKKGGGTSRTEMISNGRSGLSPVLLEDSASGKVSIGSDGRPSTPGSSEDLREEAKQPKVRWQDYLKIATFPTELLSHTPLISAQGFEVLEASETPKSPGHSPSIMSEDRGFLPSATTTAALTPSDSEPLQPPSESEPSSSSAASTTAAATLAKEDAEPVRLLLENLNSLHDTLQREKTVRWNDFLRKVRAERKRDGEVAAAAAAAAAEARFQRATAVMPETRIGDGELIGVASLGIQGKMGRAKANEFRSLILSGIPVAYRAKIWSECSGAKALRIPGYYATLTTRPETPDDPSVVAQIKADITRTLTDNIFFRKGPGVAKLHEVLLAYSRRNPDVGYCQGMNLVAANLLLLTPSAEDAFWILCSLVESILPPRYLDHSLLASRADQIVLRQYVAEILPRLSAHFDALSIDLETMTFQWFLSLFTDCLSAEALFRVWDMVLCNPHDGGVFLFQVALALLKLNERMLLACASPAEVYTIDGLVQASEALRRLVRKEEVEGRRAKAMEGEAGGGGYAEGSLTDGGGGAREREGSSPAEGGEGGG
ncbi:rab-GTPase-TBC domain-containing protein [Staphylotrichum tortipilum]|uniref:Rab-GTPase-TBC domain-containing protein n=1 Tax=Staphylotrichum tortipilum TaxID=2831512 RepID=A0AAN6MC24_9PEZI|nr:rab-GTPase-TBC domain-containing protein [Staphylotrichum longicolle]